MGFSSLHQCITKPSGHAPPCPIWAVESSNLNSSLHNTYQVGESSLVAVAAHQSTWR